jgi:DNA-binding response OmpR family regulator
VSRPLTVLIVEDNDDTANTLAMLLSLQAHEPHIGRTGEDALVVARDHPPDVVLLDLGLPGLDGYEVAEWLGRSVAPRPVLAAVTAYGDEAHVERCREAGFDRHFLKPVAFAELTDYLHQQAERRRQ